MRIENITPYSFSPLPLLLLLSGSLLLELEPPSAALPLYKKIPRESSTRPMSQHTHTSTRHACLRGHAWPHRPRHSPRHLRALAWSRHPTDAPPGHSALERLEQALSIFAPAHLASALSQARLGCARSGWKKKGHTPAVPQNSPMAVLQYNNTILYNIMAVSPSWIPIYHTHHTRYRALLHILQL